MHRYRETIAISCCFFLAYIVLLNSRAASDMALSSRAARDMTISSVVDDVKQSFSAFLERNYRVYFINMESSFARRLKMEDRLGFLGGKVTRVSGVNFSDPNSATQLSHGLETAAPSARPGHTKADVRYLRLLGCSLSHLMVYEQAWKDDVDVALVLEDDIVLDLVPFWTTTFENLIDALPINWTLVQLSITATRETYATLRNNTARTTLKHDNGLEIWGTVAYLISRNGIKSMLETYLIGPHTFDLSGPLCIEADDCILPFGVPPGTIHIATPPWFTNDPGGDTLVPGQDTSIAILSYRESVSWNFASWIQQSKL